MYTLLFSDTSLNQLKKLDKIVQKRILSALNRIKVRPEKFVRRLVNYPYFRLRAGDYRIILDIKKQKLLILVVEIDHRKKIYK